MKTDKIIVLGAGLIGKTIATELYSTYDVTCSDINTTALKSFSLAIGIPTTTCDFSNEKLLKKMLQPYNMVISAVPGFIGFNTLKYIIEAGKNVVDISFFPEDPFLLNDLAIKKNVTAVVDCGVAPGMCNIIAGYHHSLMKITKYECMVGGIPRYPVKPFNYKAVFSPSDVIEEYVRPARMVEKGKQITKDALSEIEKITVDEIGELESFNSDGLRTLLKTMSDVHEMKEKTIRYPGHAELMKVFRDAGFFSKKNIVVAGEKVCPLDVTSSLLFPIWKIESADEDITVMRIVIEGKNEKHIYTLTDKFDKKAKTSSMARTTGYTCTAVANLLLNKKYTRKGIIAPEFIGKDEACFKYILNYLSDRNIIYKKKFIKKSTNKKITTYV